MRVSEAEGLPMLIRKLLNHERVLFADHLKRLPAEDRQFRFARPGVSDHTIDRYVAGIAADDLVLGALAGNRVPGEGVPGERVVAAVHIAFADDLAELGVSVDADLRSRGLGDELIRRAIRWARNRRVERLYTLCQADNRAMVALATKLGMAIHRESGTAEAYLPLPPPDLLTVSDELAVGLHVALRDWTDLMRALLPAARLHTISR